MIVIIFNLLIMNVKVFIRKITKAKKDLSFNKKRKRRSKNRSFLIFVVVLYLLLRLLVSICTLVYRHFSCKSLKYWNDVDMKKIGMYVLT